MATNLEASLWRWPRMPRMRSSEPRDSDAPRFAQVNCYTRSQVRVSLWDCQMHASAGTHRRIAPCLVPAVTCATPQYVPVSVASVQQVKPIVGPTHGIRSPRAIRRSQTLMPPRYAHKVAPINHLHPVACYIFHPGRCHGARHPRHQYHPSPNPIHGPLI